MKIYVDMDGVCCNWKLEALSLIYDRSKAIKEYYNWPVGKSNDALKSDEFWRRLANQGSVWWEKLPELSHYKLMMQLFKSYGEVFYLTSIPYGQAGVNAATGKVIWLQQREGIGFRNFILTRHKYLCAKPDTVLVDDTIFQCEEFFQHGGNTILFPQPWNGHEGHEKLGNDKIISYLTKALNKIKSETSNSMINYKTPF